MGEDFEPQCYHIMTDASIDDVRAVLVERRFTQGRDAREFKKNVLLFADKADPIYGDLESYQDRMAGDPQYVPEPNTEIRGDPLDNLSEPWQCDSVEDILFDHTDVAGVEALIEGDGEIQRELTGDVSGQLENYTQNIEAEMRQLKERLRQRGHRAHFYGTAKIGDERDSRHVSKTLE
jgi:hypothetical protein